MDPSRDPAPPALVDTHCHLGLIEEDPAAVVASARAAGIVRLVDVGVDLDSSERAASRAPGLPGVAATVGVHPNSAGELTADVLARLRGLAALPQVVAIGETGLDYYREGAPKLVQRAAFAAQIELARDTGRALVVHCRAAFGDVFAVLAHAGPPERVVLHCFTGDAGTAERAVAAGCYVSFSGTVTFHNAPDQRAACARVPLDRLLLETDSPYLTPHPFRGQPNRPARVRVTAEAVAVVHGLAPAELAQHTTTNACRAFRLSTPGGPAGEIPRAASPAA